MGVRCGKLDLRILQIVYNITSRAVTWGIRYDQHDNFFKDNTVIIRLERSECIFSLLETKKFS